METPSPAHAHKAGPDAAPSPSTAPATPAPPTRPEHGPVPEGSPMVSLRTDVPEALLASMRGFIERHPNWDQYRLIQAALAGFLIQQGWQTRDLTRCYLANLFPTQVGFRSDSAGRTANTWR